MRRSRSEWTRETTGLHGGRTRGRKNESGVRVGTDCELGN